MSDWVVKLLIGAATSAFGAVLGYLIPLLVQYRTNRQRKGLAGKWLSHGHTGSDKAKWIDDEVEIKVSLFGIMLENKNGQFKYLAKGQLVDSRQLNGTWYSRRPGAYDSGPFMFVVAPHGNYMYGVYVGRNEHGENFFLGWCLGRDAESLEQAKQSLKQHTLSVGVTG